MSEKLRQLRLHVSGPSVRAARKAPSTAIHLSAQLMPAPDVFTSHAAGNGDARLLLQEL